MDATLAYCGLVCDTCPIHLATLEPDPRQRRVMREDIARLLRQVYGMPTAVAAIDDCDGCHAGGRLYHGCAECPIRPCASARGLETCADCPDYACERLQQHWAHEPESRTRLEQRRVGRPG